jgi:D-methionine transport system ATP-binding protein
VVTLLDRPGVDRTPEELTDRRANPEPSQPVVRLDGVSKRFGAVTALDDVSFEVKAGEILGIIGRSGAGKSTLIRCLNGLEKPDTGRVEILGRDIVPLGERDLQQLRQRIGMIFQHFNLLSAKTVARNVALPLKIADVRPAERTARVAALLDLVGLSDKAAAYPAVLSGGQKQRVGIARALAAQPALLLSDEATSALDPETTRSILALLRDINRRLGLTIVLITHEMSVIRDVADRVIVLDRGRIVEAGEVWRVLAAPAAEPTQRLLGSAMPELPPFVQHLLQPAWSSGTFPAWRAQLVGDAAGQPILTELTRTLGVAPIILHAALHKPGEKAVADLVFAVAVEDAGFELPRRVGEVLSARVSHLEMLGYVRQFA